MGMAPGGQAGPPRGLGGNDKRIQRRRRSETTRTSYATATAGTLRQAGYELLPAFDAPDFEILVPPATVDVASSLLYLFGPAEGSPYPPKEVP